MELYSNYSGTKNNNQNRTVAFMDYDNPKGVVATGSLQEHSPL